ncbi:MAG: phosphoribosylamine--glycine ligase [Candidatus Binataceae bacterium]
MKVLVIGKGGREHALCWRLHQSQSVWGLFCASGNPGINQLAEPVPISPMDFPALVAFARDKQIDLVVVGPDDPLGAGIVDEFTAAGIKIFGPTKAAAQIETSKSFAKSVMKSAGVPTAGYRAFDDADAARSYVSNHRTPLVVKADGLALGKGVTICADRDTAIGAIDDAMGRGKFGAAGQKVVIEEFLTGEEVSFFALCDGENAIPFGMFQDHKAIFDGDRGPNTGGMGAYSPLPQFGPDLEERVMSEVVRPTLEEMSARGMPFKGLLFAGLMVDGGKISVVEFNARFGDPESQPLMMRFEGDLGATLLAAVEGNLKDLSLHLSPRSAVSVVLASPGYPGDYPKGIPIKGLEQFEGDTPPDLKVRWAMKKIRVKVFHAGTALKDGQLVTDGGRVLAVTAMAPTLELAVASAYEVAGMIEFEGKQLRRDIAHHALSRSAPQR